MALQVVACFLLFLLPLSATGRVENVVLRIDDRSIIPLCEPFAFGTNGNIELVLTNPDVKVPHDKKQPYNGDQYGFVLASIDGELGLEDESFISGCPLRASSGKVITMRLFSDAKIRALVDHKADAYKLNFTVPRSGGLYYLLFANCAEGSAVSLNAHIEMYNVDANGRKDYLSVGETELTSVYWVTFSLFVAVTLLWGGVLYRFKESVHKIHYLMLLLGVFKALTLMSQALELHYIRVYGRPDGWNIAFYVFTFMRGLLFFTVVILVGTGWSYMKPFVGDKEKKILMVVLPLQVVANLAIIITQEASPALKDWFSWRDLFHLVDIICCCAILFPIVWSIKHLREASQTDGKAARCLEKMTLFRQFYVMVVVYIYFTRIVVFLIGTTVDYRYAWISAAAGELATLAFYVWTGIKFRPHKENPYLKLNQDDLDA